MVSGNRWMFFSSLVICVPALADWSPVADAACSWTCSVNSDTDLSLSLTMFWLLSWYWCWPATWQCFPNPVWPWLALTMTLIPTITCICLWVYSLLKSSYHVPKLLLPGTILQTTNYDPLLGGSPPSTQLPAPMLLWALYLCHHIQGCSDQNRKGSPLVFSATNEGM